MRYDRYGQPFLLVDRYGHPVTDEGCCCDCPFSIEICVLCHTSRRYGGYYYYFSTPCDLSETDVHVWVYDNAGNQYPVILNCHYYPGYYGYCTNYTYSCGVPLAGGFNDSRIFKLVMYDNNYPRGTDVRFKVHAKDTVYVQKIVDGNSYGWTPTTNNYYVGHATTYYSTGTVEIHVRCHP